MVKKNIHIPIKYVKKGWGYERWIVNCDEYCGKILFFANGKKCSWHHHEKKDEVFYLESGRVIVKYSEDDNIESADEIMLYPGQNFHIYRGLRHQVEALEDSVIFEFSTKHLDSDSYRIVVGD